MSRLLAHWLHLVLFLWSTQSSSFSLSPSLFSLLKSGLTRSQSKAITKSVKKRIIKRLQKLEEEEEGSTSEEEDPIQIVYMDSDDETMGKKRKRGSVESETEEEKEEVERTYLILPLEKWIPTWDPNVRGSGTLNTVFVELPSVNSSQEVPDTFGSNHGQSSSSVYPSQNPPTHHNVMVRSTILDRFGNYLESVVGDNPAVLAKKVTHVITHVHNPHTQTYRRSLQCLADTLVDVNVENAAAVFPGSPQSAGHAQGAVCRNQGADALERSLCLQEGNGNITG